MHHFALYLDNEHPYFTYDDKIVDMNDLPDWAAQVFDRFTSFNINFQYYLMGPTLSWCVVLGDDGTLTAIWPDGSALAAALECDFDYSAFVWQAAKFRDLEDYLTRISQVFCREDVTMQLPSNYAAIDSYEHGCGPYVFSELEPEMLVVPYTWEGNQAVTGDVYTNGQSALEYLRGTHTFTKMASLSRPNGRNTRKSTDLKEAYLCVPTGYTRTVLFKGDVAEYARGNVAVEVSDHATTNMGIDPLAKLLYQIKTYSPDVERIDIGGWIEPGSLRPYLVIFKDNYYYQFDAFTESMEYVGQQVSKKGLSWFQCPDQNLQPR